MLFALKINNCFVPSQRNPNVVFRSKQHLRGESLQIPGKLLKLNVLC